MRLRDLDGEFVEFLEGIGEDRVAHGREYFGHVLRVDSACREAIQPPSMELRLILGLDVTY